MPLGEEQDWNSIYFFTEWKKAWLDLLQGGVGRPRRVPRTLFLHLICVCEVQGFPGWEVRALRVENPATESWLVLDSWPSHLDPDIPKGWPRQISDCDLTCDDLPPPNAEEDAYHRFALSTDGYAREGNLARCGQVANEAKELWSQTGEVPRTLRTLRSCLFFEQRRAHHGGYPFDESTFTYVRALVERMREILC
jgi:hypothetical protein